MSVVLATEFQPTAPAMPLPSDRNLPEGSCDAHTHIFGPFDRFPLKHPPGYPVPLAPVDIYLRMLDLVDLKRGLLVQPTQQGTDMGIMLDALQRTGGRLRGIGAARRECPDEKLQWMRQAGVCGLRFVEARTPEGNLRPGAVGFDELAELASRMRDLEWSVHAWAPLPVLMESIDKLMQPGLSVVLEHMGMLDVTQGIGNRHFRKMLALLREGRIHVKLSICRCSAAPPDYSDIRPFFDAMIAANPDCLVWGSDWPFIRMQGREPDVGRLLDLLREWLNDAVIERKVLVDNPASLFGFAGHVAVGSRKND